MFVQFTGLAAQLNLLFFLGFLSPHLEGEPAGAEDLQSLHGRILDQLPVRVKHLKGGQRKMSGQAYE